MGDWPRTYYCAPPILIPAADYEGQGANSYLSAASTAWLTNNMAYFYPFHLNTHETAYQLLFWVGATSSGNIDVGIYDSEKNLIVSAGSTAMSATVNTWQQLNIADTPLPPGDYLLGINCSTTVGTCFAMAAGGADEVQMSAAPVYEQSVGATALPDPCVPVVCTAATPPRFLGAIQLSSLF